MLELLWANTGTGVVPVATLQVAFYQQSVAIVLECAGEDRRLQLQYRYQVCDSAQTLLQVQQLRLAPLHHYVINVLSGAMG